MTATTFATNDNSNPQQGTPFRPVTPPHRVFKTPPYKRDERKLFVGGLPANITGEEFKEFFGQFGTLVDSIVMFDRETHCSRGFGFVTFEDPNVCRQLLMMGNEGAEPKDAMSLVGKLEMHGKMCEVKAATPKEGNGRARAKENRQIFADPVPMSPPNVYGYPPNMGMYYPPPVAGPYVPPPHAIIPGQYITYTGDYPHPNVYHGATTNLQLENGFVPQIVGVPLIPQYGMPMETQHPAGLPPYAPPQDVLNNSI